MVSLCWRCLLYMPYITLTTIAIWVTIRKNVLRNNQLGIGRDLVMIKRRMWLFLKQQDAPRQRESELLLESVKCRWRKKDATKTY